MDRTHVTSTFYICWAAQAGLYYHYGIPKYPLEKKMFGIFEHHICDGFQHLPIFRGFDDVFYVPHSVIRKFVGKTSRNVKACR